MKSAKFKFEDVLFISVEPGEDVLNSLNEIIKKNNIKNAAVLTAYGTFDRIHLHWVTTTGFPPVEYYEKDEGPYEVLSIGGVIVNGEPHLHVTVSNRKGAYGGHLHEGCRVLYVFEMVLGILDGPEMRREIIQDKKIPRLIIGKKI
jgi:predicted DNA-binding protein with PD1-like motif